MWAVRKVDVKNRDHQRPDDRYIVQIARGGKPVSGIQSERISGVEEDLMHWQNAGHIHGWFVDNVQQGKNDRGHYFVQTYQLRNLLEVCEKVLDGSQLVRKSAFRASDYGQIRRRMETQGAPPKVIRNVSVAHKLLPTRAWDYTGAGEYDEAYLKAVEATRDWAERMLMDEASGVPGQIFYHSS